MADDGHVLWPIACPEARQIFAEGNKLLDEIIAKHTKKDLKDVRKDTERDYFMSSEEAKEYGIIDKVISEH